MSVQSQIDRINENVVNTYSVLEGYGAEMPQTRNTANLPRTVANIKAVLYNAQTLTEAQKAQARQNIGAIATAEATDSVEILLPSEAVAVVGVEFNIYHKSIIRATRPVEDYDVKCYLSNSNVTCRRYAECFRLTAEADDVGDYTLTVEVRNLKDYAVVASKTMTLHIIENRAMTGKNVLFIGDSLTFSRAGLYAAEIQYNLSNGGIVSIGTQNGSKDTNQVGNVKHEGYNGATCGSFLKANITSGFTNPFYNPASGIFDLAYFMTNNGYTKVDAVCLNLGHNNLGNQINGVNDLKTIIQKIHTYDASIPIIVSLIAPLGDQNAHASQGNSAGQMRYHWRQLIKAYIDAFDNGKISNVYLSTPYFNVDQDNDFPIENVARCARDTTQIVRQNDSMHPTRIGTLKMADSYYADLLYRISDTAEVYYTVTNNLTNVTNSNSADEIREGSSYSATLTANSGYELDAVSVTMGGQAVTVANGVINIASVTGNIVITATAKAESTVVNLVDPSTATSSPNTTFFKDEWLNGYYISSSISAKSGCIVTDLFPVTKGQKIKVEGILLDTTEHKNRFRWCFFNASGGRDFGGYVNFATKENVDGGITIDAANNTAVIDTSALNVNFNNTAYARFSCYPAGANEVVIVTVVE